jgi:hypothetical protein
MPDTPNLKLPYIVAAQAQKHVTHNEAIRALDALVHLAVIDRSLTAPPASPADGDRYIVASGGSGAWSGHALEIAAFQDGGWAFFMPRPGWRSWVVDEGALVVWDGSAWTSVGGGGGGGDGGDATFDTVGINASADATNRLTMASAATLLTHDGAGHQLKINKLAAADTASLLFQTNWSGRAEMGTAGDDDFHIKVSPDGSAWHEALVIDKDTGAIEAPVSLSVGASAALSWNERVRLTSPADGQIVMRNQAGDSYATLSIATPTGSNHAATKAYVDGLLVEAGAGDMLASVYDPEGIAADVFDLDNMVDGTTNKSFTAGEKTKLAGISAGADVTDYASIASDLTSAISALSTVCQPLSANLTAWAALDPDAYYSADEVDDLISGIGGGGGGGLADLIDDTSPQLGGALDLNGFPISPAGHATEIYNGTSAQSLFVYNTRTDASNYERGTLQWAGNAFEVGTQKLGTGSARELKLIRDGSTYLETVSGQWRTTQQFWTSNRFGVGSGTGSSNDIMFLASAGHLRLLNGSGQGGGILFVEMSEPAAPAANSGLFFLKDNGAGKTQCCIRFATGATQVIATEP